MFPAKHFEYFILKKLSGNRILGKIADFTFVFTTTFTPFLQILCPQVLILSILMLFFLYFYAIFILLRTMDYALRRTQQM